MRLPRIALGKKMRNVKLGFGLALSGVVIVLSLMLFIYPAVTICMVVMDSQLNQTGQCRLVPAWFESAAGRFLSWATTYLDTHYAKSLRHDDIPATEWPMFGAVFFLVTAEDLQTQGKIDATRGTVREAVEKAAEIVASPMTATWVRTKWGTGYLEKENVFYRMLLILGLSSYERITGGTQYHALMSRQRVALADELSKAKVHLRDDYPGECYPADMLWAVAAIQRAARLDGDRHDGLAKTLMTAFDGPVKAAEGLPAFQAESRSGRILQGARGCGNSGSCCSPPNWTRSLPAVGTTPTKRTFGRTPAGSSGSRKCRFNRRATSWMLIPGRCCAESARSRQHSELVPRRRSDGSTVPLR